jgi:16S rRNA C967 or C1407 C5-methylase (RsmB/RsmF family)/NOL1/NOP2/fmu family ribosome biogenesis protein
VHLPEKLLQSLEGVAGFNRSSFEEIHQSGEQVTSIRLNPRKVVNGQWSMVNEEGEKFIHHSPFTIHQKVPWTSQGYYLSKRPSFTFDPLFHAGCYYVQEASSMFLEQAVKQTVDVSKALRVLDLCAAPGGKTTHLASLISDESLLVSNEVIRARAGILKQNVMKWGLSNIIVTSNDPKHFSSLEGFFDVIVIDAPCSGSGLFRREPDAINEWSIDNVALCSARQRRILNDVLPALKTGGVLIYSTCSYSQEEDEDVVDELVMENKLESIPLEIIPEWNIVQSPSRLTKSFCYRFYPDQIKGEGFFISCFRKNEESGSVRIKKQKGEFLPEKEKAILAKWMDTSGLAFMKQDNFIYGLPLSMADDLSILKKHLYIQYAGLNVGEIIREKFIPDHALALNRRLSEQVKRIEFDYHNAIRYLQRKDMDPLEAKGWMVACFKGFPLGWINALPNRVNNYYPKELRILKQENDSAFEN